MKQHNLNLHTEKVDQPLAYSVHFVVDFFNCISSHHARVSSPHARVAVSTASATELAVPGAATVE